MRLIKVDLFAPVWLILGAFWYYNGHISGYVFLLFLLSNIKLPLVRKRT